MAEAPAFDPAGVPVQPAATLLLLDDRPELEVLLLRRRAASAFVPGMYVFPGGKVDAPDGSAESTESVRGLTAEQADRLLGLDSGALAFWFAGVRETLEEAGVLFAVDRDGEALNLSDPDVASRVVALRETVDGGHDLLARGLRAAGWRVDLGSMPYVARWITPQGPPRRYDTRFFVASLPPGQEASPDESEALEAVWSRPGDALARFDSGEWPMMPPTVGMLKLLAGYGSAARVVEAALRAAAGPEVSAKVETVAREPGWQVVLPSDANYDRVVADGIYSWIRLPAAAGGEG